MISFIHIIILALVQGFSEFLPVSSTAHLIIISKVLGWPDHGQLFEVALHFGTLGAVVCYFWRDILGMVRGIFQWKSKKFILGRKLFLQLTIATIPAVIIGGLLSAIGTERLRGLTVIAWASLVFGSILYLADRKSLDNLKEKDMTLKHAMVIGLIQAIAFIPGASRLGSCLTALRILGFNRSDAIRYAYLMSIPLIIAATTLVTYKALQLDNVTLEKEVFYAASLSFLAGLGTITFMMQWVRRGSFAVFAIYRILLGIGVLWFR